MTLLWTRWRLDLVSVELRPRDACAKDNGDGTLDLARCLDSDNYTHTCYDAVWDSTR